VHECTLECFGAYTRLHFATEVEERGIPHTNLNNNMGLS